MLDIPDKKQSDEKNEKKVEKTKIKSNTTKKINTSSLRPATSAMGQLQMSSDEFAHMMDKLDDYGKENESPKEGNGKELKSTDSDKKGNNYNQQNLEKMGSKSSIFSKGGFINLAQSKSMQS